MRIAILISGRGSNMQVLAKAIETMPAELVLVASDKPDAAGLEWAKAQGHNTWSPNGKYKEAELKDALVDAKINLVCLAGFMRILSADFIAQWPEKVLNIHPSLLPAFPGLDTHARALERGVKFHGCTVHLVDAGMDTGPILDQAMVSVCEDDKEETLAARVLEQEHKLYPQVLKRFLQKLIAEAKA